MPTDQSRAQKAATAGPSDFDPRVVVAEIYAEVHQRRQSGQFPAGFERELDAAFARFAPPAASGDDLDTLLDRAERAAFIDVDVPTNSRRPGVPVVKQALRKAMAWYLRYLAQQVSAMGGAVVRAERLLAERVIALETAVPGANPRVADEIRNVNPTTVPDPVASLVRTALAGIPSGRVCVAECRDTQMLHLLRSDGHDVYGVEPRHELLGDALRLGFDVRAEEGLGHLRKMADAALAALVVIGIVEVQPLGAQLALADRAAAVVCEGGAVVIASIDPSHWRSVDPVRADLAAGHPLEVETWTHLLRSRSLTVETLARIDGWYVVVARR